MAGQVANHKCIIGDNSVYIEPNSGDHRVTIRLSTLSFVGTDVKVYQVKQSRTLEDRDLLASFQGLSSETIEIKDLWIQGNDEIIVNSTTGDLVVNINKHRLE